MAGLLGKRSADELNTPLYSNLEPVLDEKSLQIDKEQLLLVSLSSNGRSVDFLSMDILKELAKNGSKLNLIEDGRYQYTLGGHGSFNNYFVFHTAYRSKKKIIKIGVRIEKVPSADKNGNIKVIDDFNTGTDMDDSEKSELIIKQEQHWKDCGNIGVIPKLYFSGYIETDENKKYFCVISDHYTHNLTHYLKQKLVNADCITYLSNQIVSLLDTLLEYNLVFFDLTSNNIVVKIKDAASEAAEELVEAKQAAEEELAVGQIEDLKLIDVDFGSGLFKVSFKSFATKFDTSEDMIKDAFKCLMLLYLMTFIRKEKQINESLKGAILKKEFLEVIGNYNKVEDDFYFLMYKIFCHGNIPYTLDDKKNYIKLMHISSEKYQKYESIIQTNYLFDDGTYFLKDGKYYKIEDFLGLEEFSLTHPFTPMEDDLRFAHNFFNTLNQNEGDFNFKSGVFDYILQFNEIPPIDNMGAENMGAEKIGGGRKKYIRNNRKSSKKNKIKIIKTRKYKNIQKNIHKNKKSKKNKIEKILKTKRKYTKNDKYNASNCLQSKYYCHFTNK